VKTLAAALLLLASCSAPPAPAPEDEHVLRPIPDAPEAAVRFIERGDETFIKASAAQRAGDSASALDLYRRARTSYMEGARACGGFIPQPLQDRAMECVQRMAALQRRGSSP
jgi:hypothetical protein